MANEDQIAYVLGFLGDEPKKKLQEILREEDTERAVLQSALEMTAHAIHQAHLFHRVNGGPMEGMLNEIDHAVAKIVEQVVKTNQVGALVTDGVRTMLDALREIHNTSLHAFGKAYEIAGGALIDQKTMKLLQLLNIPPAP